MGLLLSQPLLLSCLLALILLLFPTTSGQNFLRTCSETPGTYAPNSTYEANLKALFSFLSADGPAAGIFQHSVGSENALSSSDRVYGFVTCGGVNYTACRDCLRGAAAEVLVLCEGSKAATVWSDGCLLRYSDRRQPSSSTTPGDRLYSSCSSVNIMAKVDLFYRQLGKMMDGLVRYAAAYNRSSSGRVFVSGEVDYDSSKIYGLVQCARNQSAEECDGCLRRVLGDLRNNCQGTTAWWVILSTCYLRYDVYPFYSSSAMVVVPLSPTNELGPSVLPPGPFVSPPSGNLPTGKGNQKKASGTLLIIIVICSGIALVLICIIAGICLRKKKAVKKTDYTRDIADVKSLLFDLSTLKVATNNFSDLNKLGEGGFGAVYKGLLSDGQEIAVKKLSAGSGQGLEQFENEVVLLAKQEHRNLIRLLGVCLEEDYLLAYEYMPNKSLDTILFDPYKCGLLNWEIRYNIIEGIARGLLYLHEESQYKIIHRDLKASNILLGASMNPKISDFGISRLFDGDQTHASTNRVVGTFGYMAPEYIMRGQFSNKSDVFSFGVLVLEIVTGCKSNSFSISERSTDLLSYVWQHWTDGTVLEVVDPSLDGQYLQAEVSRCIQIGLLCVQEDPTNRPTISSVVLMLESNSTTQEVPLRPSFYGGNTESDSL